MGAHGKGAEPSYDFVYLQFDLDFLILRRSLHRWVLVAIVTVVDVSFGFFGGFERDAARSLVLAQVVNFYFRMRLIVVLLHGGDVFTCERAVRSLVALGV